MAKGNQSGGHSLVVHTIGMFSQQGALQATWPCCLEAPVQAGRTGEDVLCLVGPDALRGVPVLDPQARSVGAHQAVSFPLWPVFVGEPLALHQNLTRVREEGTLAWELTWVPGN
jgi:hypothetical protein